MSGVPESCLCCKFCEEKDGVMTCQNKGTPISGFDYGCIRWRNRKGQSAIDLLNASSARKAYRKNKNEEDL